MIQNGLGGCDKMVSDLRDEMNDAAEIIKRKRMSLAGAIYLWNVVLMPRALYRLKLSNATDEQIDRIQSGLRRTIVSKAHITAANSSILFGGYMGCGWKRWKLRGFKSIFKTHIRSAQRGCVLLTDRSDFLGLWPKPEGPRKGFRLIFVR